ncbi:MAG TPA: ABC-2 family transporter protein [Candidatus Dormibacteraeota bacterium]|nr:ABC-2 family transporter protein [Candidatus Dormibacteraeota bacterium]
MAVPWAPARKYVAVSRIQLRASLVYPLDAAGRAISIVLFVVVFLNLWRATYQGAGRSVAGLGLRDVVWYLAVAEVVMLSQPRTAALLAQSVKDGSIAYQLARPYRFLLFHLAARLGDTLPLVMLTLAAGGAAAWLAVGAPPTWWGVALLAVELPMAWLLNFLMSTAIGLLAFSVEDTTAFEWIYNKLMLVVGGVLIPLDFFPGWLRGAATLLPFASATYTPAHLFVRPGGQGALELLAVQAAWIVVLGSALWALYRRGMRRLVVNGG